MTDTETDTAPTLTSRADVATDAPARYAKQLASHLGRKVAVREEGDVRVLDFGIGSCTLTPGDGVLAMLAEATDEEGLARIEQVVGSHLERFGQKRELAVTWVR